MPGDNEDIEFGDEDPEDRWSEEDGIDEKIQVLELTIVSIQVEREQGGRSRPERRRREALEAVGRTMRLRRALTARQEDRLSEIADVLEELGSGK